VTNRHIRAARLALIALALVACKGEGDEPPISRGEEERTIVTVQSYVYAAPDDTSSTLVGRIRDQIKSAFGALRRLRVTGSNKEMSNGASEQLYKEPLVMLDTSGRETLIMRVWFRYTDEVFAPAGAPRGVPMLVGGLHRQPDESFTQIVTSCTANTARDREYRGRLQSVFDGSLSSCQDAILAEQSVIDAARVRLDAPDDEIVPEEFYRVYLPVVARLYARKAAQMGRYPRFESVVPQTGKVVAAAPAAGHPRSASDTAARDTDSSDDGVDAPAVDRPAPLIVPGAAGPAARQGPQRAEDEEVSDPDAPPADPGVPVVIAGGAKGASSPVQPRHGDVESSFNWEDLGDKKYWVLWLAVFALYPLLKRRPSDS